MSGERGAPPRSLLAPELDPELHEFARRTPLPPLDPEFRDALRSRLWEQLLALLARLRGR